MDERSLQNGICERLAGLGWELTRSDSELGRPVDHVIQAEDLTAALIRLNPLIAEHPKARAEEVIAKLQAILLSAGNDGLVADNEEFTAWMCGRRTVQYVGTEQHEQVKLIDFENPRANTLRVTAEATYRAGREQRRYDIVLWVNGLPLVVGETKKPGATTSWLNAATDIHNGYEAKTPAFFVPNVASFATDGRDFRYGAVRQSPEMWLKWAKTTDPIATEGLAAVMRSAELLLAPEMVLEILAHFTLYSSRRTAQGALRHKIIPRYPQVEAVEAIVERCCDPHKRQGLIWHHQGSGKTFAMAFAAAKLRHIPEMDAPTIVVVLDRLDLTEQTLAEFRSAGIPTVREASDGEELREMLLQDTRGVIVTTIFRFKDAGELNDRENIVVMVDEAHRTQYGSFGLDMRTAVPNANFVGFTGTPIASEDRNTWAMFGDPADPDGVLNHYSVERSIHDGATLPVRVETRPVDYQIDAEALQEAFDELAEEEGLDEEEKKSLTRRAGCLSTVMLDPDRIEAVCSDIVNHYRARIAPLDLKAQVVAYDRATCVAYHEAISALLQDGEEATVVMTTAKDDPVEWDRWDRDRHEEARVKDRFRDIDDPLKFLIVTAKLLTGFDAPIEGVMYLDKPLRAHTLFQAVCRTNRRWKNPRTGQEKLHGLVVDYVGMGEELAKAVAVRAGDDSRSTSEGDLDRLFGEFAASIAASKQRFRSVAPDQSPSDRLLEAQKVLAEGTGGQDDRSSFAAEFKRCQGLFEFLYPDPKLDDHLEDYRFLATVYHSIRPSHAPDMLLWQRLGAKTIGLVHTYIADVSIGDEPQEEVALDAETLRQLQDDLLDFDLTSTGDSKGCPTLTATEILQRLEERIRSRMEGSNPHRNWRNLAERLEELRLQKLAVAETSAASFNALLRAASGDIKTAEQADDEGRLDEVRVHNPRTRAASEILRRKIPDRSARDVDDAVHKIDEELEPHKRRGIRADDSWNWKKVVQIVAIGVSRANLASATFGTGQLMKQIAQALMGL